MDTKQGTPTGVTGMTISKRTKAGRTRQGKGALRGVARLWALSAISAMAAGLAGCGSDMELNGKIFDLMGVSSAAQAASKQEPKMAVRSGLVLPPDASRLPAPGSEGEQSAIAVASINDPDKRKAMAAAERARLHKAHCSGEMNWQERVRDKNATPTSPYGPCSTIGEMINQ